MTFSVATWHTPKAGYETDEYEDAFAVSEPTDTAPLRVAVTDGATGATFSALWATLLAQDYANGKLTPETLVSRAGRLSQEWNRQVQGNPLPWYAQAKITRDGSHAALCGVTITPGTGTYHALCVGDCAVFHLRPVPDSDDDFALVRALPYARWDDFGSSPVLIGTSSAKHVGLAAHIVTGAGVLEPGDVLYVMSDALAAWFLREWEKKRAPWKWLAPLDLPDGAGDATLSATVRDLRDTKRLKDDDVTVVRVVASLGH